ncbi:hypothetical protein V3C99_010973 [Haemonchus contortus]|uniref:Secreted protein n=1 Tax=Haemonchus contortus TaxID=6289 RepID=A0A7I4Y7W6_HAECO
MLSCSGLGPPIPVSLSLLFPNAIISLLSSRAYLTGNGTLPCSGEHTLRPLTASSTPTYLTSRIGLGGVLPTLFFLLFCCSSSNYTVKAIHFILLLYFHFTVGDKNT